MGDDSTRGERCSRGAKCRFAAASSRLQSREARLSRARRKRRPPAVEDRPQGRHGDWAVNQDPTALAPWGVLLEASHWGSEFMYDSLLEWDLHTQQQPASRPRG